MERKKFDDQLVAQWIQLHRKGEPYRSIGRTFDVDPRTVKSWIQRAGKEKEMEHWEAVSRQVDAKYLDEHCRMLLQIAAAISDSVHTDPLSVHHELDADVLLNGQIQSAVRKSEELLAQRGLNISSGASEFNTSSGIKDHATERLARRLLAALLEHEPQLKSVIEAWESDWTKFQKARLNLIEVAGNLFKHANVGDSVAEALKIAVVREALENRLINAEPWSSRVDVLDDKNAHLVRYSRRTETRVYTGSKQEIEGVQKVYDNVLSQISHRERISFVKSSYQSLTDRVREAEDYIDRLILIGKPHGKCALCLSREIPLLE